MLTFTELTELLITTGCSIVLGIIIALCYMYKSTYNKQFVITLALLPAIVQAIITLVNGNVGTGLAVMGAFSLVRFRSVPGNAKDIGSLFFAMAVGLATGMTYIEYAIIFTIIMGGATLLFYATKFGEKKHYDKILKISIPENLDYLEVFDDLFKEYTVKYNLIKVKTANLGSLYKLEYNIVLKSTTIEKQFIDELRCRNGNLEISISREILNNDVL